MIPHVPKYRLLILKIEFPDDGLDQSIIVQNLKKKSLLYVQIKSSLILDYFVSRYFSCLSTLDSDTSKS